MLFQESGFTNKQKRARLTERPLDAGAAFFGCLDEILQLLKFFMGRSEFHAVNPTAFAHLSHLRAVDDAVVSVGMTR